MAAAEAWDVALPLAPTWGLGSVVASLSAMLLQSQWRWQWAMPLQLRSQWAWVLVLACRPRLLRREYRPDPSHTRYWVDPRHRIESKRCGQRSYSTHRGSR